MPDAPVDGSMPHRLPQVFARPGSECSTHLTGLSLGCRWDRCPLAASKGSSASVGPSASPPSEVHLSLRSTSPTAGHTDSPRPLSTGAVRWEPVSLGTATLSAASALWFPPLAPFWRLPAALPCRRSSSDRRQPCQS